MNREIKFKAKRVDNSKWIEGDLVHDYWLYGEVFLQCAIRYKTNHNVYSFPVEVRPETVCQFTGLKDRNGNEIYEGDINRNGDWVEYAPVWAKFGWTDGGYILDLGPDNSEVIGNIHDEEATP